MMNNTNDKKCLYGAWISRTDFIPVPEENHAEVGLKLLNSTLKVNKEHDTKRYSIYKVMFRLGYVRVIYFGTLEVYGVEYWQDAKLSKFQKEFISSAESQDKVKIYYRETFKGMQIAS